MKKVLFYVLFFAIGLIDVYGLDYTVVKGDTLWDIAKRFYGNPFLWQNIFEANENKIKNPNLIYPDQVFIIPEIVKKKLEGETLPKEESASEQHEEEGNEENVVVVESSMERVSTPQKSTKNMSEEKLTIEQEKSAVEDTEKVIFEDTKLVGKIVFDKKRFMYTDGDIVKIRLSCEEDISVDEVLYVFHKGKSKYDLSLKDVSDDEMIMVGKVRVLEVNGNIIKAEVVRCYSPLSSGDFVAK